MAALRSDPGSGQILLVDRDLGVRQLHAHRFLKLQRAAPGFDAKGVATAFVGVPAGRYPTPARQADFFVPISFFATLETNLANSLGAQRIVASLTTIFAGLALVLSAVGLYSVLAYAVSQRTSEIGIRMALGARPEQVIGLVMRNGLGLVAIGLGLGLAAAAGAARLIETLLFEVRPLDPLVYGGVALVFAVVATLACLVPSARAARIDPLRALRTD